MRMLKLRTWMDEAAEQIVTQLKILSSPVELKEFLDERGKNTEIFDEIDIDAFLKDSTCVGLIAEGVSVDTLMSRLVKELDLKKAVSNVDFVIEAVSEVMDIKQKVFQKLVEYSPPHAILASNSSSFSISKIADHSGRADKVIGMHFFHAYIMKLIEITKGDKSSEESALIGAAIAEKLPCMLGARDVISLQKESPAFIANRIQLVGIVYVNWMVDKVVEEGVDWDRLDADLRGILSISIIEMLDRVGLDVVYYVLMYLANALSPDLAPGKVLTEFVKAGNLGMKTGQGFYEWNDEGMRAVEVDKDQIQPIGFLNVEALLALHLNEGCRLLEEGVVSHYEVIDEALYSGYHTPGPFSLGKDKYKEWSELLEKLAEETGKDYFKPCELMKSGGFMKMRR